MTDWYGRRLTLDNHDRSKGRVVACANEGLHREAVAILGKSWGTTSMISSIVKGSMWHLAAGVCIGIAIAKSKK